MGKFLTVPVMALVALMAAMMVTAPVLNAADGADPLIAGIKTFEQGKHADAVKQFTAVFTDKTRSRSDTATALYYRGKAYLRLNQSAAALTDLKSALWLNELSAAQKADAKGLEAGILKAAGLEATTSDPPARRAAHIAPPSQASRMRPSNWSPTTASAGPERSGQPVQTSTAVQDVKPGKTEADDKLAAASKPPTWRDAGAAVARGSLPPATRVLPAPTPPERTEPAAQVVAAPPPAKPNAVSSPWSNKAIPVAHAPVVTGSIPKREQQPARPGTLSAPNRPDVFQAAATPEPPALPARRVATAAAAAAKVPTAARTGSWSSTSSVPRPNPPAAVPVPVTPAAALPAPAATPATPAPAAGLALPSLPSLTSWLDTPSPVADDIAAANLLQNQRMERIKLYNKMMRAEMAARQAQQAQPAPAAGAGGQQLQN